jgi:hypothetical protein
MKQWKLSDCDIVTAYDPARTRESEYGRNARNALMTTACTPDYDVAVLDYFAKRCSLDEIYTHVCQHVELYHPRCIGVEDVAVQIAIGDAFQLLAERDGINLPPLESLRPDTRVNKKWRIKTLIQKHGPYGRLYYIGDAYEFKSEFGAYPSGRTIDILDVYTYCISMHNIPDNELVRNYNDSLKNKRAASRGDVIDIDEEREKRYTVPSKPPFDIRIMRIG